jgi:hypothetical protein
MVADDQAESILERNRLSAIAKIKQDLASRSVTGVPLSRIIITRQQAKELVRAPPRLAIRRGDRTPLSD